MISYGHSSGDVWEYTPKQTLAYLVLAQRRKKRQLVELISLHSAAAQGSEKSIRKLIRNLEKDMD